MATSPVPVRIPSALLALIDAQVSRDGTSRTAVILDALGARFMGESEAEPARPMARAAPRVAKAPAPADPRAALAQAESRVGVRTVARLDTSMVEPFMGGKRPAYQKGQGAGKAKGGSR